jgi:hypothetical protein
VIIFLPALNNTAMDLVVFRGFFFGGALLTKAGLVLRRLTLWRIKIINDMAIVAPYL